MTQLLRGVAQEMPFSSGAFDTVLLCFSGLAGSPAALAEARRVLESGGRLVVVDEVRAPKTTLSSRFIGRALSLFDCEEGREPHDLPLRSAGFDVQTREEVVGDFLVRVMVGAPQLREIPP